MFLSYKLQFDYRSLILFAVMMIPTIVWSFVAAPVDVLRMESQTSVVDIIGSISQSVMIAGLCLLANKNAKEFRLTKMILVSAVFVVLYFIGWVFYYCGIVNPMVILSVTIPPCLSFLFYSIDRKNFIAIIADIAFMVCHIIFAVVNFII